MSPRLLRLIAGSALALTVAVGTTPTCWAQTSAPAKSLAESGFSSQEVELNPTNAARVMYNKYGYGDVDILPSIKNEDNQRRGEPRRWDFRYRHPLHVVWENNNSPKTEVVSTATGVRVTLFVKFDDEELRAAAFQAICEKFPEYAAVFVKDQVGPLSIRFAKFSSANAAELVQGAVMETGEVALPGSPSDLPVVFRVPSQQEAAELISRAEQLQFNVELGSNAVTVSRNTVSIAAKDLQNSSLRNTLFGPPEAVNQPVERFVRRSDLRSLIESNAFTFSGQITIEDPERFKELTREINTQLLRLFESRGTEPSSGFSSEQWAKTYLDEDLKPDQLTRSIEQMISVDEKEKSVVVTKEGDGKLNVPGQFDLKVGGKYTKDDLVRKFASRDFKTEWEGNKFIVKGVDLVRVNRADFDGSTVLASTDAVVKKRFAVEPTTVFVRKGKSSTPGNVSTWNTPPVGSVLAFAGTQPIQQGWLPCDGREIDIRRYPALAQQLGTRFDPEGKVHRLPNLNGRFIAGTVPVPTADCPIPFQLIGTSGGKAEHVLTLEQMPNHDHRFSDPGHNHSHDGPPGDIPFFVAFAGSPNRTRISGGINLLGRGGSGVTERAIVRNTTGINFVPQGESKPFPIMPPYVALTYVIRAE